MSQRKATIIEQKIEDNEALLTLKVDGSIADFSGHFPNYPLLPGVTQIDWAIYFGKKLLNAGDKFAGMEVIKFQEPILPEQIVQLKLKWDATKEKLYFTYQSEGKHHSSGRIKLLAGK